jgi:hypothetical protein
MNDKYGWVYCLTNESIIGQVKVGQTGGDPADRAKQISGTGLPTPYKVVFAKKVYDYKVKERILHKLLEKYEGRTNPRREFFQCDPETVRIFFDLMDGEWYNIEPISEPISEPELVSEPEHKPAMRPKTSRNKNTPKQVCNIVKNPLLDANTYLIDGIEIKHVIKNKGFFSSNNNKYGKYIKNNDFILCDKGKMHKNLRNFIESHYDECDVVNNNPNSIDDCYYECYDKWILCSSLMQ